ncbi:MAG: DUF4271 domain-containing protein [Chitinophagaceae bacterium]
MSLLFLQFNQFYLLRLFLFFIFLLYVSVPGSAQDIDSAIIPVADSSGIMDSTVYKDSTGRSIRDSVSKKPGAINIPWQAVSGIPLREQVLQQHPYFNFNTKAISPHAERKQFHGKEFLFYVITLLVLLFALLRLAFFKYFNDLFRVFFRTTMKQRQIKEQLMQTPLPSLVFNGFFVASAGLYLNFLLHYFNFTPFNNFWLLYLYCCIGLSIIYLVKFVGLIICGWLFNMQKAADSYIFIVFIINKVIGISLLPFLVLLGFTDGVMYSVSLVLSWCCVGGLLLYRFILGFSAIRNEVRFNLFHFFLYLCAFEIAPLLLIYKVLLFFF